jgi:hypothetical protein
LRCAEGSWMPCGLVASKVFFCLIPIEICVLWKLQPPTNNQPTSKPIF